MFSLRGIVPTNPRIVAPASSARMADVSGAATKATEATEVRCVPHTPRGFSRNCDTHLLTQMNTDVHKSGNIFPVNYGVVEVNVEKLRELRVDQGFSQRQLALKAGLSPGAVAVVEQRGRAHPETLKKLADVLGVRASELVKD
jgi:ribosome-binding protein aMBF1 (putative translation factor)